MDNLLLHSRNHPTHLTRHLIIHRIRMERVASQTRMLPLKTLPAKTRILKAHPPKKAPRQWRLELIAIISENLCEPIFANNSMNLISSRR